jgi:hypothetical protein
MAKKVTALQEAVQVLQVPVRPRNATDELLPILIRKQEARLRLSPQLGAFFEQDFRPPLRG